MLLCELLKLLYNSFSSLSIFDPICNIVIYFILVLNFASVVCALSINVKLQKKQTNKKKQWIQQVAGNPRWERIAKKTPQDRERRLEIQGEQRHSEGKRCQLNTEDVKRQQQNTTITLQTKPTKRGNTDCRCFSKLRSNRTETDEESSRGKFTVKIIRSSMQRWAARITPSVRST